MIAIATRPNHVSRPATLALATVALLLAAGPGTATAQPHDGTEDVVSAVPFAAGERITYRVSAARFGKLGRGSLWVSDTTTVRGTGALVLHFGFQTRVGPIKVVNETESWLDPERMASLRFHKHERHPLSRHDEQVEMFPEERRWVAADGSSGESATDQPLDELSFIYFLRTLPLDVDTTYSLDRHFDTRRNPTVVRVMGRETVETPVGAFATVIVEMRVRDARYRGEGVIRLNITDDARRLPVRIESSAPVVGRAVFLLESHTTAPVSFARVQP